MAEATTDTRPTPSVLRTEWLSSHALWVIACVLLALKLAYVLFAHQHDEEAYYWLWGQHLDWSYFDHPPLSAWLLRLTSEILGWSMFANRAPTLLTTGLTLFAFWLWAGRLFGDDRVRAFLVAAILFLSTPLFVLYSSIVFNDYLLMPLALIALYFFAHYLDGVSRGDHPQDHLRTLYFGALFLGLAVLTKYNGVFLGFGLAAYILISSRRMTHLRNVHLYLAALLAIGMQLPVILWNLGQAESSFAFHYADRASGGWPPQFQQREFILFVLRSLLSIGPVLMYALIRTAFGRGAFGKPLATSVFVVSSIASFGMCGFLPIPDYMNILGYLALIPFAVLVFQNRILFALQVAYGLLTSSALVVFYAIVPLSALAGGWDTPQTFFGWDKVTAEVQRLDAEYRPDFLAGSTYREAAKLGYRLERTDIVTLDTSRRDQFDLWIDDAALLGQSALVVAAPERALTSVEAAFSSLEQVGSVTIEALGRQVQTYTIYLGENYLGSDLNLPD